MSDPSYLSLLIRWLAITAVLDLLINRSLTRFAIFMPKSGPVLTLYQALMPVGQFAFTLTGLLALIAVAWLAWQRRQVLRGTLSLVMLALLALSLIFVILQPREWLAVGYHILMLVALALLAWQLPRAVLPPAIALILGEIYQLSAALGNALHLPGPIPLSPLFFNLGELGVVLSSFALWWACGDRRPRLSIWALAAIPPVAFAVFYLLQPAMAGIMAIWSLGLTLYLPWPVYALSLWLVGVSLIVSLRRDSRIGWAILLLTAGGYAPQLTTYAFLGLVALGLMVKSAPGTRSVNSAMAEPLAPLAPGKLAHEPG